MRSSASVANVSPRSDRDGLLVSVILPFTTFSILCYEIILTRLFAYIFAYQLTALAVSVRRGRSYFLFGRQSCPPGRTGVDAYVPGQ